MPVYYECQRCTACCRWPGQVKISDPEITAMAGFLGLSVEEFTERFTRLRPDRQGLLLTERENHECIFLDGMDCRVQPVKPQQCRDFPNHWNFPGWRDLCQAIPREVEELSGAHLTLPSFPPHPSAARPASPPGERQ